MKGLLSYYEYFFLYLELICIIDMLQWMLERFYLIQSSKNQSRRTLESCFCLSFRETVENAIEAA